MVSCCCRKSSRVSPQEDNFRVFQVSEFKSDMPTEFTQINSNDIRYDSHQQSRCPKNISKTTKYNLINFLPLAIFYQLCKYTNLYFGLMLIPSCFNVVAAYSIKTELPPFIFIMTVALLREAFEDYGRYKSDKKFNNEKCRVLRKGVLEEISWSKLLTGEVVFIRIEETFPADLVMIGSAKNDRCFIETSTLDGERALKPRESLKKPSHIKTDMIFESDRMSPDVNINIQLTMGTPTTALYEFSKYAEFFAENGELDPNTLTRLDSKNLLMKGARLKNTEWILGIACYTGKHSKIQLSTTPPTHKISKMEKKMHRMIVVIFVIQICIALFATFGRPVLIIVFNLNFRLTNFLGFVGNDPEEVKSSESFGNNLINGFRYFLLLSTLIPISLVVNLEVIRIVQVVFLTRSYDLINYKRKIKCKANTASVNEELGQIEYILTDKTGTLTENKMVLRSIFVGDQVYGGEFITAENGTKKFEPLNKSSNILKNDDMDPRIKDLFTSDNCNLKDPISLVKDGEENKQHLGTPRNLRKPDGQEDLISCSGSFSEKTLPKLQEGKLGANLKPVPSSITYHLNPDLTKSCPDVNHPIHSKRQNPKLEKLKTYDSSLHFRTLQDLAKEFLICCSVCHECIVEKFDSSYKYFGPSPDEIAICKGLSTVGVKYLGTNISEEHEVFFMKETQTFKALYSFAFTSDRKRQSVIVQENGVYKLYIKGADSEIYKRLSKSSRKHYHSKKATEALDLFSEVGLRTLVFACRVIPEKEFKMIKTQYEAAVRSVHVEKDLKKLEEMIEKDLVLLGCTAIEDNLQEQVPESIARFFDANIRVWMITGDKFETAKNIGYCSGILPKNAHVFDFKNVTRDNFTEEVTNLKRNVQDTELKHSRKKAIVVDSSAMSFVFESKRAEDPELHKSIKIFKDVLMEVDSVVCSRSIPRFKAELVKLVRGFKKTVLAIGDGANDAQMISVANVGVGLYGEEGMQAVQASDFGISNFKYLWKLIFLYGHWNYTRLAKFILFSFFKNFLFTIPQFIFGFFNFFSGSPLYDGNWSSGFNLIFTSLPISCVGLFDKTVSYKYIMKKSETKTFYLNQQFSNHDLDGSFIPVKEIRVMKNIKKNLQYVYHISQLGLDFTWKELGIEGLEALILAVMLCLITFFSCSGFTIQHQEGYTYDFWMSSFTIYGSLIYIHNVVLCVRVERITWFFLFWVVFGSLVPFLLLSLLFDTVIKLENGSEFFIYNMGSTFHYYLVCGAVIMIAFMFEFWRKSYKVLYKPRLTEYFKVLIKEGLESQDKYFTKKIFKSFIAIQNPIYKKRMEKEAEDDFNRVRPGSRKPSIVSHNLDDSDEEKSESVCKIPHPEPSYMEANYESSYSAMQIVENRPDYSVSESNRVYQDIIDEEEPRNTLRDPAPTVVSERPLSSNFESRSETPRLVPLQSNISGMTKKAPIKTLNFMDGSPNTPFNSVNSEMYNLGKNSVDSDGPKLMSLKSRNSHLSLPDKTPDLKNRTSSEYYTGLTQIKDIENEDDEEEPEIRPESNRLFDFSKKSLAPIQEIASGPLVPETVSIPHCSVQVERYASPTKQMVKCDTVSSFNDINMFEEMKNEFAQDKDPEIVPDNLSQ